MQKLTEDQKKKLEAAIDAAQGAGGCKYVKNGEPCCVIAQLGHREGVPKAEMTRWDRRLSTGLGAGISAVLAGFTTEEFSPGALLNYPPELLIDLQSIWDRGQRSGEYAPELINMPDEERREKMRQALKEWVEGEERDAQQDPA